MKRTNRDKDWAFITALDVRMIEAEDERGWMHIFNADTLAELLVSHRCPASVAAQRPALQLAINQDPRTAGAADTSPGCAKPPDNTGSRPAARIRNELAGRLPTIPRSPR
jgi:hypothetical protein